MCSFVCTIALLWLVVSLMDAIVRIPVFGHLMRAHQARRAHKSAFGAHIIISALSPSEAKSRVANGVLHRTITGGLMMP